MPEVSATGRVAGEDREGEGAAVSTPAVLGTAGTRFRYTGCKTVYHRSGSGCAWRKPDGPYVYGGQQRGVAL